MRPCCMTFWSCLVILVAFFAHPASLRADSPWAPPPPGPTVRDRIIYVLRPERRMDVGLECLVDGRPVPTIRSGGRTYLVVPRLGAEYEIRVWNHGPRRIAALVGVDGLSVITGKPVSDDQLGYLVDPQRSVLIKGWRRNLDTVAAFTFNKGEDSYASRMGYPEKIGHISLLAIEEAAPVRASCTKQKTRRSLPQRAAFGELAVMVVRAPAMAATSILGRLRCRSPAAPTGSRFRLPTTPRPTCAGLVCRSTRRREWRSLGTPSLPHRHPTDGDFLCGGGPPGLPSFAVGRPGGPPPQRKPTVTSRSGAGGKDPASSGAEDAVHPGNSPD